MLARVCQKPNMGILSMSKDLFAPSNRDLSASTNIGSLSAAKNFFPPILVRGLATVQANTPRQMPSIPKQRRTPVSHDTANLTIRV